MHFPHLPREISISVSSIVAIVLLAGAALLPPRVLRDRRPAHPVERAEGLRGPGRRGRRDRPRLPLGRPAGRELLALPAAPGRGLRARRRLRPGPVGIRRPQRPLPPADQRARPVHARRHPLPAAALGAAAGPARRGRPGADQGAARPARRPGLARLLRAARRQERDLVPVGQGGRLLPGRLRRDARLRRPARRPRGVARRHRRVPGRRGPARVAAGRHGVQRARGRGVVPRGRPDRARARRRGDRQRRGLQPVRPLHAERPADGQPGDQERLHGRGPPGRRHTEAGARPDHQGGRPLAGQPRPSGASPWRSAASAAAATRTACW